MSKTSSKSKKGDKLVWYVHLIDLKTSSKSKKGDKPIKGIKHHGLRSTIIFILIIVAVVLLISHPGEVIFGIISLIGGIFTMDFSSIVVLGIIGILAYLFFKFLF